MAFTFSIPSRNGHTAISIEPGSSVVFVGANGGGKTRLAVHIESELRLNAHRISAHRALALNPGIAKINEQDALSGLRTGIANSEQANVDYRSGHRWQDNAATSILNDFDFLVQALFADHAIIALKTHHNNRGGDHSVAEFTKFERLVTIWERLLPDRQLHISGDNVKASVCGSAAHYNASDMSDGERAIFYMGKFKTMRDGAVPDNRKAAFFDLFKLEQYVASGEYHAGLFLWLTDEPKYRIQASGDSAEFSMHEGRSCRSGTALRAKRARNRIPLPLVLRQDYTFRWTRTDSARGWYDLVIATQDKQR